MGQVITDNLFLIIVAVIGAIPGILAYARGLKESKAVEVEKVTKAAIDLMAVQSQKLADLEGSNQKRKTENEHLSFLLEKLSKKFDEKVEACQALLTGAKVLYKQLVNNNISPLYEPPENFDHNGGN